MEVDAEIGAARAPPVPWRVPWNVTAPRDAPARAVTESPPLPHTPAQRGQTDSWDGDDGDDALIASGLPDSDAELPRTPRRADAESRLHASDVSATKLPGVS